MIIKTGYELPLILIVGILHTALLKKVLDTFPAVQISRSKAEIALCCIRIVSELAKDTARPVPVSRQK